MEDYQLSLEALKNEKLGGRKEVKMTEGSKEGRKEVGREGGREGGKELALLSWLQGQA